MGMQQKQSGSTASGLGMDWTHFLQNGLNNGSFSGGAQSAAAGVNGANPMGSTQNIGNILNQLLSVGGGPAGQAMNTQIEQQNTKNVDALRARFGASGGQAFGTAAGSAEASYRAEAAPQAALAVHQMQLQALMPLLQLINSTANKGITQAENYAQPSTGANILQAIPGIAQAAGTIAMMNKGGGGAGGVPDVSGMLPQNGLNIAPVNLNWDPYAVRR